MEAHLTECVQDALAAYLYRNAVFLGERLHAAFPTEARQRCAAAAVALRVLTSRHAWQENAHLLATCYMRSRQPQRAYAVLKRARPPRVRCGGSPSQA